MLDNLTSRFNLSAEAKAKIGDAILSATLGGAALTYVISSGMSTSGFSEEIVQNSSLAAFWVSAALSSTYDFYQYHKPSAP